ncbi:MAG: NAD(P)/FAD-dependent oxidoreductase [Clostridia bacterium]|nr:NAD(P)/FAD-dependent oxidoreductase [Clostridia bacterium]
MRIAVVGGGASGIMAAYSAAENGAEVTLFERNEKLGKKVYISGKGRCNVTNDSDPAVHMSNVVRNGRFLFSAYKALSPKELIACIESAGTPLKTERGDRVFPVSDKSSDILSALRRLLSYYPLEIKLNERVLSLEKKGDVFFLRTEKEGYTFDKVILCTGGFTYQATGSTGDGYSFARAFGHSVTELCPALVGLRGDIPVELAGLTLKNVTLSARKGENVIAEEFGEMLFTHSGISGPIVLTMSSKVNRIPLSELSFAIDLKPAITKETLNDRLLREFQAAPNKALKNILPELMPRSLISFYLEKAKVAADIPAHSVTKEDRLRLVSVMKALPVSVLGFEAFNGAIVTSGGVSVTEIDPKDMQSKLVPGLYFAGELLDVDALTGGFNLQIAFSTGYLAGMRAAKS